MLRLSPILSFPVFSVFARVFRVIDFYRNFLVLFGFEIRESRPGSNFRISYFASRISRGTAPWLAFVFGISSRPAQHRRNLKIAGSIERIGNIGRGFRNVFLIEPPSASDKIVICKLAGIVFEVSGEM